MNDEIGYKDLYINNNQIENENSKFIQPENEQLIYKKNDY